MLALRFSVLALLAALFSACELARTPPHLLEALAVYPDRVLGGDTLRVNGRGFPEGGRASVLFRGALHRPGRPAEQNVRIEVPARQVLRDALEVEVDDALEQALIGPESLHTTFRGELVVSFRPQAPGSGAVTGAARNVVLDIEPRPGGAHERERQRAEGRRFEDFLGVELVSDPARAQLSIAAVVPEGPADRAGVLPNDGVLSLDGVLVRSVADFVPSGQDGRAELVVERALSAHPRTLGLEITGFSRALPARLLPAALGVLLVALCLFVLRGPLARGLSLIERGAWLRRALERSGRTPAGDGARALRPGGNRPVMATLKQLVFVAVGGAFAALSLGNEYLARELDLALLFLASATVLVTLGLVTGGFEGRAHWSLARGLKCAAVLAALQTPLLVAWVSVGVFAGSLSLEALGRDQGAWPWQWRVFASPLFLGLATLAIACALPRCRAQVSELPEADADRVRRSRPSALATCLGMVEASHVLITAGVLAVLFFGGTELPGTILSGPEGLADPGTRLYGTLLLEAKLAVIALGIFGLEQALPGMDPADVSGFIWRAVLPTCGAALVASGLWLAVRRAPEIGELGVTLGPLLFGSTLFVLCFAGFRAFTRAQKPAPTEANPWL